MSTVATRRDFASGEQWQYTTLGQVAQVKGGKRLPKGEKFADTVTSFPYLRVTDFANFSIDTSGLRYLTPEIRETIARYTIGKNDVYISIAGSIGVTGMIPARLDGANLTENAAKLVLNENVIDPCFLMYYLASEAAQTEIRGQTVKNAQPKLALARIASLRIPLLPLFEQRKVAAVLGLVQRAIEQQDRLIALTTELKKALLHKLFTEGVRGESQKQTEIGPVPESWEVRALGDYLTEAQYGISAKGGEIGRYAVLRMTNQRGGRITPENLQYVDLTADQFRKFRLEKRDILFNRTNSLDLVGRTAIFDIEGDFVFASYLIRLRTQTNRLRSVFLNHYFNWDETQVRLKSIATRAVSQSNISATRLRGFLVPVPTTEEQDEIVEKMDVIEQKLSLHARKHAAHSGLFRTLLHQLMTAQVRVRDLDVAELEASALDQAMPNHPDAIGFLKDLADEVDEPWFKMVCDLAISGESSLDQSSRDTLFAIFTKRASYVLQPEPVTVVARAVTLSADFLETLLGFSNFKLLEPTLQLTFTRPITIVFGTNGSGKSSICESLKVLASSDAPSRPLYNVRLSSTAIPGFSFKFRSDVTLQSWSPAVGYGPKSARIKYFDAGIALKSVESAVEPGRIVVVTPYKLHVFEWAKALTSEFRSTLQEARETNAKSLAERLEKIRAEFSKFKNRPLAALDEKNVSSLSAEIKIGEAFDQSKSLQEKQNTAGELDKAASEEGLKLLRAEHRELESFLSSIAVLVSSAENLWSLQPSTKGRDLAAKQAAQELLANELIPHNGNVDELFSLVRAASPLCNLESAEHEICPLCRRELKRSEADLFKKYYELLTGKLEKEIESLRADLQKARELVEAVRNVNRKEWDKYSTLPADFLEQAKTSSHVILENCDLGNRPAGETIQALKALKTLASNGAQLLVQKSNAIEIAAKGKGELVRALQEIQREIEPLAYAQAVASYIVPLKEAKRRAAAAEFWAATLPSFTPLLKKITDTAKETYRRLVVSDFEARLNAEYKALTEKPMTAFGVTLENRGSEALVTLLPQVGGKEINDILSEGEQRVHAVALFFAELEACSQSVIVFDDPVSSFDYNFIANYCARLRDFAVNHPERQIIVLTHNWEFFVQLQLTLNKSGLNNNLSVQVLENCAVVADYSEKVHELKNDISGLLLAPAEPSRGAKEELAGKMRRLIESVVNTHVFNNQRHQFKQKSLPVTDFPQFIKVTPLLSSEATVLADLYAKLSISEHDDPRNAYVNTDKATFESRYNAILAIETAVVSRKQQ